MTVAAPPLTLADLTSAALDRALSGKGVRLDVGDVIIRLRSDVPALGPQLQAVYRHFPLSAAGDWTDFHVDLRRSRGLRRWLRPQATFVTDGQSPFEPFPGDSPLPLLEWGTNWLISRFVNDRLLLHAGVVERDGLALVLPAIPGSGKSTLTAALTLRGWRLLSDEFAAVDLETGFIHPVLKPVGLKNESIEVIRRFAPNAEFGPEFPGTRKGTVAHLAPQADAVARVREAARPGGVVLPQWREGSGVVFQALPSQIAFTSLAFNAFNYAVTGSAGFRAVVRMVRHCPAWKLMYSNLDDALDVIESNWLVVRAAAEDRTAGVT